MNLTEINYSTDFLCTYQLYQDEENIENEQEQEDMYRIQYLQAFKLTHWDDDIISNTMDKLYEILKKTKLNSLIEKIPQTNHSLFYLFQYNDNEYLNEKDKRILFNFLFQFDLFYLTHICICEFINNKYITEESIKELEKAIDYKINR